LGLLLVEIGTIDEPAEIKVKMVSVISFQNSVKSILAVDPPIQDGADAERVCERAIGGNGASLAK
jgi:hypothetical protein